eukprot:jgi/Phyca11/120073/e_gw1.40.388.1
MGRGRKKHSESGGRKAIIHTRSLPTHQFRLDVVRHFEAYELGIDCVYNADQTPVLFEYLPKSTINKTGARTVWVRSAGKDKERFTCMLLGDAFGRKYPPCLVMKTRPSKSATTRAENTVKRQGFGKRLWKQIKLLSARLGAVIYGNSSGWWNESLMIDFLTYNFSERADMDTPVLFLLDEFSAHWTDSVVAHASSLNVELMRIPAGCTGVCQPADVEWNRPLKQ